MINNDDLNTKNTKQFIEYGKNVCMRCKGLREIWVYKDTEESTRLKVDCPMCSKLDQMVYIIMG
jgi:phage FluMu protein Com